MRFGCFLTPIWWCTSQRRSIGPSDSCTQTKTLPGAALYSDRRRISVAEDEWMNELWKFTVEFILQTQDGSSKSNPCTPAKRRPRSRSIGGVGRTRIWRERVVIQRCVHMLLFCIYISLQRCAHASLLLFFIYFSSPLSSTGQEPILSCVTVQLWPILAVCLDHLHLVSSWAACCTRADANIQYIWPRTIVVFLNKIFQIVLTSNPFFFGFFLQCRVVTRQSCTLGSSHEVS